MKLFNKIAVVVAVLFYNHGLCASEASRTSGVAPLSVHFTADLVASSPGSMPFHDYEYVWNFGDVSSGNWGTTGKPKNTDKGPVTAHVYETPGTYTATLTVRNSNGVIDTDSFIITVSDPDAIFSGTKTTCVSTGTDFTGCPVGAAHVTTNDLTSLSGYTDAGERVLLRRGDSWTSGSRISFPNNSGPVHIGAFGTCSDPDSLGICGNAPTVTITGTSAFFDPSWKKDWRLTDISFVAEKGMSSVVSGATKIQDILFMRIKSVGFASSILFSNYRKSDDDYHDNNSLVSSKLTDSSGFILFMGSERLSIMGNVIQNSDDSHACRVWHGYQGVISHNIISGSNGGRHTLKLHGPAPSPATPSAYPATSLVGTFAETGNGGLRSYSKFIVITNNVFGSGGNWLVSIGPQDQYKDERLSDIIFEKNRIISDFRDNGTTLSQNSLMVEGRYVTIRNNVIDGSGSSSGFVGIQIWKRGIEWSPLGNRVYNNTVYNPGDLSSFIGVSVSAEADDTIVKNNIVSFPNTAEGIVTGVSDLSGSAVVSNNLKTDTPSLSDPNNANPLFRNFAITVQSTDATDQGATVPVFDDFLGLPRYGSMDIGAFRSEPRRIFRNVRLADPVE